MAFRVIRLSWDLLPAGAHPFLRGPSSKAKQIGILLAQVPFFLHVADPYESKLSTAHRHTKKAQPSGCALLCFRDSVGIRTQDPQLRRLLLYPAELPNRSVKWVQM